MIITIDGPAAAGKGTLSQKLADKYCLAYFDTGMVYRAVGLQLLKNQMDLNNVAMAEQIAEELTFVKMMDLSQDINFRSAQGGNAASIVSSYPGVRSRLLNMQRRFAENPVYADGRAAKGVIYDGRDTGTVICPQADIKFFITASSEVRAQRRYDEFVAKGMNADYKQVLADVVARDERDANRKDAPMKPADDAIIIDTSNMGIEQVFEYAVEIIEEKIKLQSQGVVMMKKKELLQNIYYVGVDDKKIDLFEGQYVVPNGISYNSYVIKDDKVAVFDTVDRLMAKEWFANLEEVLGGKDVDYLVVLHMEPDHAANVEKFLAKYQNAKIIGNAKTFNMLPQFFENLDVENRKIVVAEGDEISLGEHNVKFIMAPMVHWPEVMMAYETKEKILFSADAFGKFGALSTDEDWACEARRYYFNIVGKYGAPVQALLKKTAQLDIQRIFPLHGPMLMENLGYYIGKYDVWSKYEPEDNGIFIAYASIYGNTKIAAETLKEILEKKGAEKVIITDLARSDMAEAVEDAFRYDKLVLASVTYDGDIFPCMETFISHLKSKAYQNRKIGFIENGSWAPVAAKKMKGMLEGQKNLTFMENVVTIKSAMNEKNLDQLENLANELLR
ncbi:MAG: (d)CMP kinase [Alphaproteobacteria bacterium]|nr:(d)CMP kinase [Alphaproteobacteria bacterium]